MKIQPSTTPNPNARKFTVEYCFEGAHNYASSGQATDNPLAHDLFTVTGVINVFTVANFVTVNKVPTALWEELEPKLIEIIRRHLEK